LSASLPLSFVQPEHLGSCPVCGCLILVVQPDPDESWTLIWDPGVPDRAAVERLVGEVAVARQGFGLIRGGDHECPPEQECRLWM
jgi:hypothetical protein